MGVSCGDCGSTINFCPNCGKPMGAAKKTEPKKEEAKKEEPKKEVAAAPKKEEPKKEAKKEEPKKEEPKKEEPKKEAAAPKKEEPKKEEAKKEAPKKKESPPKNSDDNLWLFLITILTILMGLVILSMFQDDLTFLDAPKENGSSHIQELYRDLR